MGTAVYRLTTEEGTAYFLKLRKGFEEIVVTVPLFLKSQGIQETLAPVETVSNRGWADFGEYKISLYPFIEGKDGFEMELSDQHRQALGTVLKAIHKAQAPTELKRLIPKETFSPYWRESLRSFQEQVESQTYNDPTAVKLAAFMKSKRDEINRLIERAERLVSELQTKPLEFVLCHADIHGGNILIRTDGQPPVLYIVDWDNPLLAPK
jgi:spectinomycin phosphotransferase